MVIDAHAHLAGSGISGLKITADQLLSAMDNNGIDVSIVQPFPYPVTAVEKVHDEIAELSIKYKGRIFGMASINPHWSPALYRQESIRCMRDLGFVGLKLHPWGHMAPINSQASNIVFDTAVALHVPIMIHTGSGIPYSLPALAIPRAAEFPGLKIILAHAGQSLYASEALVTAMAYENIYLETSWSAPSDIEEFVKNLGAGRVMLGSDLPNNQAAELAKYSSIQITQEELKECVSLTAKNVFALTI